MYNVHTLLVQELVNNFSKIIIQEQGNDINITIQPELAFHTEEERKSFYKSYKWER